MPLLKQDRGFTLIELLIAITIIAVLSVAGMTAYTTAQAGARDARRKEDLDNLKKALYSYRVDKDTFCLDGTKGNPCTSVTNTVLGSDGSPVTAVLSPKYMQTVSKDPQTNYPNYWVNFPNADSFILSAKLENTPPSNLPCIPAAGYNYCVSE